MRHCVGPPTGWRAKAAGRRADCCAVMATQQLSNGAGMNLRRRRRRCCVAWRPADLLCDTLAGSASSWRDVSQPASQPPAARWMPRLGGKLEQLGDNNNNHQLAFLAPPNWVSESAERRAPPLARRVHRDRRRRSLARRASLAAGAIAPPATSSARAYKGKANTRTLARTTGSRRPAEARFVPLLARPSSRAAPDDCLLRFARSSRSALAAASLSHSQPFNQPASSEPASQLRPTRDSLVALLAPLARRSLARERAEPSRAERRPARAESSRVGPRRAAPSQPASNIIAFHYSTKGCLPAS